MAAGTRIQHVNLMVDDLARAVEFYGTALGLAPAPTPEMGFPAQFFEINDVMQMFVRDPAGNLIELSCESDQHVDPAIFEEALFEPAFLDAT
jgi:catechol 2,3-dioxygenase-like lactoylglutathione lyase family enzyme